MNLKRPDGTDGIRVEAVSYSRAVTALAGWTTALLFGFLLRGCVIAAAQFALDLFDVG